MQCGGGLRLRQLTQRIQSLSHQPLGLVLLRLEVPQGTEGSLQGATGRLDDGVLIDRRRLTGNAEACRALFHSGDNTPMPLLNAVLLVLVLATGAACNDDEKKPFVDVSVHDLRPGSCFLGTPRPPENAEGDKRTVLVVAVVRCSAAHEKEVFAVFEHPAKPDSIYPGEDKVAKVAQDGCADRFADYVGRPFGESELQVSVIAPGPVPWDQDDDRTIVCSLEGSRPLKGSQKGKGD